MFVFFGELSRSRLVMGIPASLRAILPYFVALLSVSVFVLVSRAVVFALSVSVVVGVERESWLAGLVRLFVLLSFFLLLTVNVLCGVELTSLSSGWLLSAGGRGGLLLFFFLRTKCCVFSKRKKVY